MIACVIDTSAILAYAFAERGAANVERWIDGGAAASTLTVQEAVSKLCQSGKSRNEAEDLILSLGLVIQDLDLDLAFSAGAMFDLTKPYGLSHGIAPASPSDRSFPFRWLPPIRRGRRSRPISD
ncbi:PIN domain-containing protein [Fulvimarina sp. 2208YS6-2-32]|uniref:PIN domain-containing protein n=1 Tax=Fulvimarina uroteuthidis TaxID=3098149 RepID=A0ABU5I7J7_9HYPH|nr:PIN domain-containing protein [Fulvimarina sp. 2208YS6-2-32]MDY8111145.1 PIN domain-containing protein [Fulvimarina sp. 2208YS6-2-32]